MENLAIEVKDLTKIYKLYNRPIERLKETFHPKRKKYNNPFFALKNVTFNIEKGDTVGIVGKNGAGKSTILKIITGVLTPSAGEINVNGRIAALLELGAGFNPEMTGLENIYMNGTLMGYSIETMDKKLDTILEFADIGDFIHQQVKMYSSGMFVRLAFAISMSVEPDILIVDEALSVGDMSFQLKCMNKIREFKKQGKTILFVSHDIYTVRSICNKAIWFNNGQLIMMDDCEKVVDGYEKYMKKGDQYNQKDNDTILEIQEVDFYDNNKNKKNNFQTGDDISVEIKYEIFKDIKNIVGGIAIYDSLGIYVCGLNTKLDKFTIEDKIGKHKLILNYNNIKLLSGIYYIEIGFFEGSAIVKLDYKSKYKSFTINSDEHLEGLCLLDHKWDHENLIV